MSAADIYRLLRDRHRKSPVYVENKSDFLNYRTEADAVAASLSGVLTEYEVKISRADFLRDATKHRTLIYNGERKGLRPNRFYYVTAAGIITESDLPIWAGWIEHVDGLLVERRKAPKMQKERHDIKVFMRLSMAMRFRPVSTSHPFPILQHPCTRPHAYPEISPAPLLPGSNSHS